MNTVKQSTLVNKLKLANEHIKKLEKENKKLGVMADRLLSHCQIGECEECSKIVCQFKDPMHFHHDGCPSCVGYEQTLNLPKAKKI